MAEIYHLGKCSEVFLDLHADGLVGQISCKIPTCRILRPTWCPTIDAYIIALGEKCPDATRPLYLRWHGLYRLSSGAWIYVAGDEVLGKPDGLGYQISETVSRAHLAWNPTLPLQECVRTFCQRLEQSDHILIPVWAFTIFSSLRSSVHQLNLTTLPTLAILGGQNFGKTTVAQRYMLLYNDSQRPGRCLAQIDAHSTAAATIDQVEQYRDQVVLVDDLAKSVSTAEQRARLELIAEILRFASNDVDRVRMAPCRRAEARFCQAGVAFTGEFRLHNPSDLTRLVIVDIQEQMGGGTPTDRTLAATVFRYLMRWLLPELDREIETLRQALDDAVQEDNIRMRKNRMVLLWALRIFYSFAYCTGAVTSEYANWATLRAGEILDSILVRQARAVERAATPLPVGNLSWYILIGYQKSAFHIVPRKKLQNETDCVVEQDALCVSADTLLAYFRKETPYRELTKTEMNRRLSEEGAIVRGREERSARKRIRGRRYLEFNFAVLKKAARSY